MHVTIVPCLSDNYAYVLAAEGGRAAVVVDPGEDGPVIAACTAADLDLVAILNTHHHWDHVGGNHALTCRYPDLRVFGHELDRDRIPGLTDVVVEGAVLDIAGLKLTVMHVPGHTRGAVAYVGGGCAFTGDTLFAAGCGRLFEGTATELYQSLNHRLARLPPDTRVFCGHEYTLKNLTFARMVEPGNERVGQRLTAVTATRARRAPTVPTTMGEELLTNPFLRTSSEEIRIHFALNSAVGDAEVFAALRAARNRH